MQPSLLLSLLVKSDTSAPPPQQLFASVSTTKPLNAPAKIIPAVKVSTTISRPGTLGLEKKFLNISNIFLIVLQFVTRIRDVFTLTEIKIGRTSIKLPSKTRSLIFYRVDKHCMEFKKKYKFCQEKIISVQSL